MSFVPNTNNELNEMLQRIGVNSFEDLLKEIPSSTRVDELDIADAISEMEALSLLKKLSDKNLTNSGNISFMGGGIYDHYIPTIVGSILEKPEFKTAYTPYQAEVSQGTLQVMYEFQTMITRLTGMEISNASLYDAGTGLAEACLMANANTKNKEILIAGTINPLYLQTAKSLVVGRDLEFKVFAKEDGTADLEGLKNAISDDTAAVIVQHPNFFGNFEDVFEIEKIVHTHKALYVSIFNPISLGLITPPGKYNADIALGEGQSLGINVSFGGPVLGLFTCKEKLIRTLPGRIVGMTIDADENRAFVLTLQTREQQIKREKATSNICTNQGLIMLAATVYMETMGKEGLREVAEHSFHKAHYLANEISGIDGFEINSGTFFNEFLVKTNTDVNSIIEKAAAAGFLAGINVEQFTDSKGLLIAVTEKRTKTEMDKFVEFLKNV
ncbi:MAG: glycine dehydrogenase (aminomethyl-transferring) [Ignavibacteria bacterium GWF2_33_9]|nr:MAG: glycine dehydrogenase (aminomethyl-transferring) [Ignavibacteria bacterium GWF2_33_9]